MMRAVHAAGCPSAETTSGRHVRVQTGQPQRQGLLHHRRPRQRKNSGAKGPILGPGPASAKRSAQGGDRHGRGVQPHQAGPFRICLPDPPAQCRHPEAQDPDQQTYPDPAAVAAGAWRRRSKPGKPPEAAPTTVSHLRVQSPHLAEPPPHRPPHREERAAPPAGVSRGAPRFVPTPGGCAHCPNTASDRVRSRCSVARIRRSCWSRVASSSLRSSSMRSSRRLRSAYCSVASSSNPRPAPLAK